MTVTAPIDVETQHEGTPARDASFSTDIVIVDHSVAAQAAPTSVAEHRDPAMILVYLGVLSLVAIVAIAALLAL